VEARFSVPVQAGPEAPPSLLYNGYWVSFPGVRRSGRGVDHPPTSTKDVKKKESVQLHFFSPLVASESVVG